MKKTFTTLLILGALTMMSFIITKEDTPLYKNLKILPKNITKDQMDSVMHHFAGAMGQRCNFCHVFNDQTKQMDFASDAKEEKETARGMWKMMIKLNKKLFDVKDTKTLGTKLQVTCFTCHHGSSHPETTPPARMGPPPGGGMHPQGPPPAGADTTKH